MQHSTTTDEEKRLARKIERKMWLSWTVFLPAIAYYFFELFYEVLTQYLGHSTLPMNIVRGVGVVLYVPFHIFAFCGYLSLRKNGHMGWPRILAEPLGMTHKIAKLPNGVRPFWHKRFLKPYIYVALYIVILEIAKLFLK